MFLAQSAQLVYVDLLHKSLLPSFSFVMSARSTRSAPHQVELLQSSSWLKRKLSLFVTPLLKVKHGGTNVIVDAMFISIYYIQFDKCNMHAITILGEGRA